MKIPNIKKILKPTWLHKPGFAINEKGWYKQEKIGQATTPEDSKLLNKLEIKKGDKVLAIAGYYASWASALKKLGAKVDYSDISKPMVNWVKKNVKTKFGKYICSNYELIPKKSKEYDWTFTFEACGGGQGLPIAYLRSLLNKKGGILVLFWNEKQKEKMGGKPKRYPKIVKTLAKTYNCKYKIKRVKIKAHRKGQENKLLPHLIYIVKTNNKAREKAEKDLKVLFSNKKDLDSLKRLSKLCEAISDEYVRELK